MQIFLIICIKVSNTSSEDPFGIGFIATVLALKPIAYKIVCFNDKTVVAGLLNRATIHNAAETLQ